MAIWSLGGASGSTPSPTVMLAVELVWSLGRFDSGYWSRDADLGWTDILRSREKSND